MARAAYIAGDWGTSRLRLSLCDSSNNVLDTRAGPGAAAARGAHQRVLEELTAAWQDGGMLPVVLCGMVGSSIGWLETPYLPAPVEPRTLAGACASLLGGGVRIVAGVRCRNRTGAPDVMRGEETQILGALRLQPQLASGSRVLCLPGTHAKWVVVRDGAILEFLTAPTGELFELLGQHSVLLRDAPAPVTDEGFAAGLARVRERPGLELLHRIFEVRSARLVGGLAAESAAGYLSGLLVGSDVAGALALFAREIGGNPVTLIAGAGLRHAYARALGAFGIAVGEIDGDAASLAGLAQVFALNRTEDAQRAIG